MKSAFVALRYNGNQNYFKTRYSRPGVKCSVLNYFESYMNLWGSRAMFSCKMLRCFCLFEHLLVNDIESRSAFVIQSFCFFFE